LKSENKQIEFVDGTVLEDIDVVIYSTGYNIDDSFLEENIFTGGCEVEQGYGKDFQKLAWLYKLIFPPKYPNIAFIGFTLGGGAIWPVSEMQARYVISQIKGFIKPLPSQSEMEKSIRNSYESIRKKYCIAARNALRINYVSYMETLSQEIGCYPYSYEIIKKFGFRFWKLIMFGTFTPIHVLSTTREECLGWRERSYYTL
ncbi:579_t:CDS:2, partial [Gigaspora rosea]